MTDGRPQLVGLIGWPLEHSLSPAIHNAAFAALELNWRYLPLPVRPGATAEVEAAVRGLLALDFRGANVTVPHKQAVMQYLDEISSTARAIGAVNTIVVQEGRLCGYNTDGDGFVAALREAQFEPAGRRALVVGAGGAARAVVHGLLSSKVEKVTVLNRTLERAQVLVSELGGQSGRLRALLLTPETVVEAASSPEVGLLINATTVGMWPQVGGSIWPERRALPASLTVFDLVYNPLETHLLQQARESGARAVDGLGMLVMQGALAFVKWTGVQAPLDVMRAVGEQGLREQL
jgi:shikimate dehydrogenase